MALYLLKRHEQELLQMNFEQILGFVADSPKQLFRAGLLRPLHAELKGVKNLRYTLSVLEKEFLESLAAASQKRS